jgi:hypothetical protein
MAQAIKTRMAFPHSPFDSGKHYRDFYGESCDTEDTGQIKETAPDAKASRSQQKTVAQQSPGRSPYAKGLTSGRPGKKPKERVAGAVQGDLSSKSRTAPPSITWISPFCQTAASGRQSGNRFSLRSRVPTALSAAPRPSGGQKAQIFSARYSLKSHLRGRGRQPFLVAQREVPFGKMPGEHRKPDLGGVRLAEELGFDNEGAPRDYAVATACEHAFLIPNLEGRDVSLVRWNFSEGQLASGWALPKSRQFRKAVTMT